MKDEFIIVRTSFDASCKKEAQNLAKILVERKLAACVQLHNIESFYRWDQKTQQDDEILLEIKSLSKNFVAIKREILANHSYDVPQILSFAIKDISEDYAGFLRKGC